MTEAQTDRALSLADRYITVLERRMELQTRELELEIQREARVVERRRKRDEAGSDDMPRDRLDQLLALVEQLLRQQASANNLGEQLLRQTGSTKAPAPATAMAGAAAKVDANGNPV